MKDVSIYCLLLLILVAGCSKEPTNKPMVNKPPKTFLWLFPDSTIASSPSRQSIKWWGDDPDGYVKGFLFTADTSRFYDSTGKLDSINYLAWRWTTKNDTLIAFPLERKEQNFYVAVRAIDNTFLIDLPEQALIRFTPTQVYWDKNENNVFDGDDKQILLPINSIDPNAATLAMPILNQPPSVQFSLNPNDQNVAMQQPETTFTVATFAWIGSDPDGRRTIKEYRIALNNPDDTSRWVSIPARSVTIPGNVFGLPDTISMITLFVPRLRSDAASTNEVVADIYSGKFLNRQKIGSITGLKLDTLNTFYLKAVDIAGDTSKQILTMPDTGKRWFVKKPTSRILAVIDYIQSDSSQALNVYHATLSNAMLSSGVVGKYDELNIGRGISNTDKQNAAKGLANPKFGVLVPPFIDPAFIQTLFLFDCVFWYTDKYPSTPVAQLSLFPYVNTEFSGHKGKVIFSTTFETFPDPKGLLRDFAPIDSISSVDLQTVDPNTGKRSLPSFGDIQIPGGYRLLPDVSTPSYPILVFNQLYRHLVNLRPLYRRPDASYIYHIQPDTLTPLRYAYTMTLNELKSVASAGNEIIACGSIGTILNSNDAGVNWNKQKSSTTYSLNSMDFLNSTSGIIVGDTGTILKTNNSGISWSNYSVATFHNLMGVDYVTDTLVVAVGTNGLLIRSTDGGKKWDAYSTGTRKVLRSVAFTDQNNGIAVGDSVIIKTTDGGFTWRTITGIPFRKYNSSKYLNSSTVFTLGANAVYPYGIILRSTDAGDTWSTIKTIDNEEPRSLYFTSEAYGWISSNRKADGSGIIYTTSDGGVTWVSLATGVSQHLNSITFANDQEGWSVGTGAIIIHSSDGGTTWQTQPNRDLNVAVIDGAKSFVFIGLPLHLLDGDNTGQINKKLLQPFFEKVLREEFGL